MGKVTPRAASIASPALASGMALRTMAGAAIYEALALSAVSTRALPTGKSSSSASAMPHQASAKGASAANTSTRQCTHGNGRHTAAVQMPISSRNRARKVWKPPIRAGSMGASPWGPYAQPSTMPPASSITPRLVSASCHTLPELTGFALWRRWNSSMATIAGSSSTTR